MIKTAPYLAVSGRGRSGARGQREKCKCLFLSSHAPAKQIITQAAVCNILDVKILPPVRV